jgi:hypothetical protein
MQIIYHLGDDTIDCPTKNIKRAYSWLLWELDKIGLKVFVYYNNHEIMEYPSFEVKGLPDDDDENYDTIWSLYNEILEKYNKKFKEYL